MLWQTAGKSCNLLTTQPPIGQLAHPIAMVRNDPVAELEEPTAKQELHFIFA